MSHETPKSLEKDGYRAKLAVYPDGRVLLRSRRGTDMTAAFPEIKAAALAQLPADTGLDGELVVWEADRLAFERLQQRLARRGPTAVQAAQQWLAHFVAFDLPYRGGDLTAWPYARRRAALETLFAQHHLTAPWVLCPSTIDPDVTREWLTWTTAGLEGLIFKRLDGIYQPSARGWQKYKVRETGEVIVGAVTGFLEAPRTLLLGRYDDGRLQYIGRNLARAAGAAVGGLLTPGQHGHPWTGWSFSAGWASRETLNITLVKPELVRWRHPACWHRARPDLSPIDIPRWTSPPH